ncbi:MAG: tRNA (uridine(34)/cytosine(34)/5-carboxymethylaminomethyluridine(34)-2'-O)-methyltransferase TrmL [Gammaproteobacteria bacterium]|nr:tRNA (uridine(34)/cytosine(34)/5-carboxymethylaminomethyluridine(34)-2'-O)-methyltransferase TrmL [Gammaproteobacteria bacterium]
MIEVALFEPEIPPNTGNIIRLCANTGAQLHLIEPIGFSMDDRDLRRAGLDYHEFSTVTRHHDWTSFSRSTAPRRLIAFSTRGTLAHTDICYRLSDTLLFGPETRGLPEELLDSGVCHHVVRIPMRPKVRSLNLSNAVAIACYEAWRQLQFAGAGGAR